MIRLILYVLFIMIPAFITGYLLLLIFPHISKFTLLVLNMGMLIGAFIRYKRGKIKKLTAENRLAEMPNWLKSGATMIVLVIFSLLASLAVYHANKATLYIDNASDKIVVVKIPREGTWTIQPGRYLQVQVVKGDIDVEYNNKKKHFHISDIGNWVFNIDGLNAYIKTSVVYSSHTDLYKDGKGIPEEKMDLKLIREEFFNSTCDYVFDVPEKISVKRKLLGKSEVSKTVLYRVNADDYKDSHDDYQGREAEDKMTDTATLEKPVIIKSTRKKVD